MAWRWSTKLKLFTAGWRPHRDAWHRLHLPAGFRTFPEAKRILSEYGGIKFGHPSQTIVNLDPSVGEEIADQLSSYEQQIGKSLYPLGYFEHQDRIYLVVDEGGLVYTLIDELGSSDSHGRESLISSELEPLASSFERALEYLVRGDVTKQETNDDLKSVGLLMKKWTLDSDADKTLQEVAGLSPGRQVQPDG